MEEFRARPDLAEVLDECRAEIESAWSTLLRSLPESHYRTRSDEELSSWTESGLEAIIASLRTGSKEPLIAHASAVSQVRRRLGFSINEVVEGLLLMREAVLDHLSATRLSTASPSADSSRHFDAALRVLIARFALLFAQGMNESLARERDRTALLLEASEAAGSSLDLSVVLPTVARSIMRILGHEHCGIYLWNESLGLFSPHVAISESENSPLKTVLRQPLDPETESLIGDAIAAGGIASYSSAADHRIAGEPLDQLGISTAIVVPFRLANRVVAFALTLGTEPEPESRALDLASGIASSVAPAVANARRYTEMRQRLGESERLKDAAEALLEMQGLDDVVEIICRQAEVLSGARGSAVVLTEEGAVPRLSFKHGEIESYSDSDLVAGDPRTGIRELPLTVRGHSLGTLCLLPRESGLDSAAEDLLFRYTDQAAIAIQHALLLRRNEELTILQERQKLAHELHDSVAQSIHGVTMYAEAATRLLDSGELDRSRQILHELRDAALESLREMRQLVFELRPTLLQEEGLAAALQARLAAVEGRGGLVTEFLAQAAEPPPLRIAEALYGIAKEALNNVLKHAGASRVAVRLQQSDSTLVLAITDNGTGFDPALVHSKGGLGLQGMQERAASIEARLSIASSPGAGTTVHVEVPLPVTTTRTLVREVTS